MSVTSPLIARYDHVLLDLDGCVWVGDEPTPGAAEAIAAVRAAGKTVSFVTNDARHSGEEFVRKLWGLGVQAALEEVVTAGGALQHHLAERYAGRTATVIGAPVVHRHVTAAGCRIVNGTDWAGRADVVVVCGHDGFDFAELREATQSALRGAALVASSRDPTYPTAEGLWPGTGAILAAVETASGRTAETVGKPQAPIIRTALDRLGPGRALMVGDRADTDLAGAYAAGIDGALVLTGAGTREDADAAPDGRAGSALVAVAETLHALVLGTA